MDNKIAQLVDSAGNIPREILKKYSIKEVPLYFTFDGNKYFRENIELTSTQFYQHMKQYRNQIPKTSTPNVNDWIAAFEELYQKGYRQMIVTTIAKKLSSTFETAMMARQMYLNSQADVEIEVLESNSCACGQAALEIKIAQMINQEKVSWEELLARTRGIIPHITSLFSVQELTYMRAGGRIGGAAAFLGKLVNIKPVCEFIDGVVHPIKAVRGRKKALIALVDAAADRLKNVNRAVVCVQDALCEEDAKFMIDYFRAKCKFADIIYQGPVGAAVGSHSGPGAIGIGLVEA